MAEEISFADHAGMKVAAAGDALREKNSVLEQINLHHAQVYALVSIARSLETIAARREA